MTLGEQTVGEVAADESRNAGNEERVQGLPVVCSKPMARSTMNFGRRFTSS
jgi:hypothetical protein